MNSISTGDICADVVFGDSHQQSGAGLMVWGQDFNNFYDLQIRRDGFVGIWRYQDGKWLALLEDRPDNSVKKGNGEVNRLRIRATESSLTFFVNSTKVREVRGHPPQTNWYFGVLGFGQNEPSTVLFKYFKITTLSSLRSRPCGECRHERLANESHSQLNYDPYFPASRTHAGLSPVSIVVRQLTGLLLYLLAWSNIKHI
jgi:hypothetical protein